LAVSSLPSAASNNTDLVELQVAFSGVVHAVRLATARSVAIGVLLPVIVRLSAGAVAGGTNVFAGAPRNGNRSETRISLRSDCPSCDRRGTSYGPACRTFQ
jgi:hypothetical protein